MLLSQQSPAAYRLNDLADSWLNQQAPFAYANGVEYVVALRADCTADIPRARFTRSLAGLATARCQPFACSLATALLFELGHNGNRC